MNTFQEAYPRCMYGFTQGKRWITYLFVMVFVFPCDSATTQTREGKEETKQRIISFDLNAGLAQYFWNINHKSQCQACVLDVVNYDTEGLSLYRFNSGVRIWSGTVFTFRYDQSFKRSERQKQMLEVNTSRASGAEKYALDLFLDPIADRYFSDQRLSSEVFRRLLSIKFKHSRELFWGTATANKNTTFLPQGTAVDYANSLIVNGVPVTIGDQLSFRSVFSDREISIAAWVFDLKNFFIVESALRLGYFNSTWERLSDAQIDPLSASPVLYEAKFKSEGFLIGFETTEKSAPGFHLDAIGKIGTSNSIDSAIDWSRIYGKNVNIESTQIKFSAQYNYYLNRKTKQGLSLSAGASMDLRDNKVQLSQSAFSNPFPAADNSDSIFKLFIKSGSGF